MTEEKKNLAIAILKSGRSFDEASKISGIAIEELFKIWKDAKKK